MKKSSKIILIITVLFFVLAIAFFLYAMKLTKTDRQLIEESEKVDFTEVSKTKDLENVNYENCTIYRSDNTEFNLSESKGMPTVILFFNKDNEDSIKDLDKMEKFYKEYKEKITFVMIDAAEEFDQELEDKYSIEIFYDIKQDARKKYNIEEYPSIIYIDKNNEIFNAKTGFTTDDSLEANLDILSDNI